MIRKFIRVKRNYGIDADPEVGLWDYHAKARNQAGIDMIDNYLLRELLPSCPTPMFDCGSGDSLMRNMLNDRFGFYMKIESDDCNLNCDLFPEQFNNRYATIFNFELIEHILNPLFHLQQLYKIAKKGATLYIGTPNDLSLAYKAQHIIGVKHCSHFHQFCKDELYELLKFAGWEVAYVKKYCRKDPGILSNFSRNGLFAVARKFKDDN